MAWTSAYSRAALHQSRRDDLDQCPATLATIRRRLALLGRADRAILVLGDDDLLSLALAHGGFRSRIAVVDADPALLAVLRRHMPRGSVELIRHDLRKPLPASLQHQFDDVFTDPPYTFAGQLVFAHRALAALRKSPGSALYLCASPLYLSGRDVRRINAHLKQAGLALDAAYHGFNRYAAPPDVAADLAAAGYPSRWLSSDLFHYLMTDENARLPRLPASALSRIYDYAAHTPS